MSRVGKLPIAVPEKVEVLLDKKTIKIKGPKGELTLALNPTVVVNFDSGKKEITVAIKEGADKKVHSMWGTERVLIANMIEGVTRGYEKKMEVNGIGYRANVQGGKLLLSVGFSHQIEYLVPAGINIAANENIITVSGIDKQLVGEIAAQIRNIKKPEPYQGKGIKYIDEVIRRKAGKTGQSAE